MDLIQNEDHAADSCAISPTAFLLTFVTYCLAYVGQLIVFYDEIVTFSVCTTSRLV